MAGQTDLYSKGFYGFMTIVTPEAHETLLIKSRSQEKPNKLITRR